MSEQEKNQTKAPKATKKAPKTEAPKAPAKPSYRGVVTY